MVSLIRTIRPPAFRLLVLIFTSILYTYAQTSPAPARCTVSAVPAQVRAEGLTERMGDIILQCSGFTAGASLTGTLTVFLPIAITNRVSSNNQAADAILSADYGSGYAPTAIPGQVSTGIAFNGINLTVPPSGAINLKISGIRGAAFMAGTTLAQPVTASLSFSIPVDRSQVVVAYPQLALFTTLYQTGITCVGSPLPDSVTVSNLFDAGTAYVSTRLTEGFGAAFLPRTGSDDSGTRFLVTYSGFPTQTQLYLPDFVAGSDAAVPSIAGDLGGTPAVGKYLPGSGTLLLGRVPGADSTGAGGQVMVLPSGAPPVSLNSASPVSLNNGAGYAVYEVIDASAVATESVQFPLFIGISSITAAATAQETVTLAPVSTVFAASQTAPVPRFAHFTPTSDCTIVGDCGASYFPKLAVSTSPMQIQAYAGGGPMISGPGYAPIKNAGGGVMAYNITINYQSGGTGWLKLWDNPNSVEVTAITTNLQPGTYTANIVVDAGSAGSATIPLTLTVIAVPPPPPPITPPPPAGPTVTVTSVLNAATLAVTPLVAGSLGTVKGTGFAGTNVSVTFDGLAAPLLYTGATQINLQVPASLSPAKTTSSMVVTVDGTSSTAVQVALSPAWPSVFANGILNQDYSVNGPGQAAKSGDILQIFATGIPGGATVTVQIGSQANLTPLYAASAPGLTGVQQVNVAVPGGAAGTTTLTICASTGGQAYCSAGSALVLQ